MNENFRKEIGFYKVYPVVKRHAVKLMEQITGDNSLAMPLDIRKLAKNLGVKRIEETCEKNSGRHAMLDKLTMVIYLNKKNKEVKHRFAIAHEIGHLLFDPRFSSQSIAAIASLQMFKEDERIAARAGNEFKEIMFTNFDTLPEKSKGRPITEEILDYFAANLLVPTEEFLLHDNGSNKELSKYFDVEEKCITKRRTEVEEELVFLKPCK